MFNKFAVTGKEEGNAIDVYVTTKAMELITKKI